MFWHIIDIPLHSHNPHCTLNWICVQFSKVSQISKILLDSYFVELNMKIVTANLEIIFWTLKLVFSPLCNTTITPTIHGCNTLPSIVQKTLTLALTGKSIKLPDFPPSCICYYFRKWKEWVFSRCKKEVFSLVPTSKWFSLEENHFSPWLTQVSINPS